MGSRGSSPSRFLGRRPKPPEDIHKAVKTIGPFHMTGKWPFSPGANTQNDTPEFFLKNEHEKQLSML